VILDAEFVRALSDRATVRQDEPLSRHTTIGIGGPADAYVIARSASELRDVLEVCRDQGAPVFVLGSGSNIVVGDRGMRGVTIENRAQSLSEAPAGPDGGRYLFRAETGCSLAGVARQLAFAGFAGLEWACGIPGTIGGAVVYNAGAYGGCLGDVLERVCVWEPDGGEVVYGVSELGMVYRGSAFTRGLMAGRAVLWAEFALWAGDASELRGRVADYDSRRLKAQPRGRNAGSFFKNPPGQPAWRLIEAVGMRGYQVGGAQFSDKHCNFLINAGGASASDVSVLKTTAESRVREQFGIDLANEVTLVGEGFAD
jgi:UDP-N-acetylmuramate dehydrogenase